MKYRLILILFLVLVGGGIYFSQKGNKLQQSPQAYQCKSCNVILISIDTFGAKHLGLYGNKQSPSPLLDKRAQEKGIIFDQAIVQAPWTLPSHTAMLTGRYPAELGVWLPTDSLPKDTVTIAQALQQKGFKTQAISYGAFVQPEWGFDKGFDGFSGSIAISDWQDSPKIFQDSLSWIEQNKKDRFFLFIHSFHIHDPYLPSEEAINYLRAKRGTQIHISDIVKANTKPGGPTKEDAELFKTAYEGEIWDLDRALDTFFTQLEEKGMSDNTIIILTGDHGEEFGEHGTAGFHVNPYGETIRVPLIVFTPQNTAQRVEKVVETRSIPATIMDMVGYVEESFKGVSLFPLGKGEGIARSVSALERDVVFNMIENAYEALGQFGKTIIPKLRTGQWELPYTSSARSNEWHLIKNHKGEFELYNLKKDTEEKNNLFPSWESLPTEERREALKVIRAMGEDVPVSCGIYCNDKK